MATRHKPSTVFTFLSHGFSLGFVFLWLGLMLIANNPAYKVTSYFNQYGEYYLELVLSFVMAFFVIFGFVLHWKRFRSESKL